MTRRVWFVSPALNASLRQARFDDGAPLDAAGRTAARAAARSLPTPDLAVVSGSRRCRETAELLGLGPAVAPDALAAPDTGGWRGRTLAEVSETSPQDVGRWLGDPEFRAGGGESVADLCARVSRWLDTLDAPDASGTSDVSDVSDEEAPVSRGGLVIGVVEPELVRAAVVHALGAPLSAFWRCDVAPLTVTELSGRGGRWNVRCGRPLVPPASSAASGEAPQETPSR
ncbi:histidine phosphatase family protein [Streptomyces sp. NPDC057694]|uniref:histidine phosphatase family protein n=1 Tax=Streptomyces sp. NPDC057694 TaxID=3346216 RepID=UPI0036896AF0